MKTSTNIDIFRYCVNLLKFRAYDIDDILYKLIF